MSDKEQPKSPEIKELEKIRESGSLKEVPRIVKILRDHVNSEAGTVALNLLSDIKDPDVRSIMIDQIEKEENRPVYQQLIQACWQSGLDYSAQLAKFTNLFLVENYEVALEAFSLIETTCLDFTVADEVKADLRTRVKSIVLDLPEHQQNLAMELIHVLEEK